MGFIFRIIASLFMTTSIQASLSENKTAIVDQETALIELIQSKNLRLIVIRHGEATHNLKRLVISSKSPGIHLTEKGIDQVKAAASRLQNEKIDYIYVSPVYRTLQTAQFLADGLAIDHSIIEIDENLREQYFGEYEGKTYQEYIGYFPEEKDHFYNAVPQGESGKEVALRTMKTLETIANSHSNKTILIVTHAFNCLHIGKLLTGEFPVMPMQAEYNVYDFRLDLF
jgi:broad specificity phosphatase PhoE